MFEILNFCNEMFDIVMKLTFENELCHVLWNLISL